MYWTEVRAEAWARAKQTQRPWKSLTGAGIGLALSFLTLSLMHVVVPVTLIVGASSAIGAALIVLLADYCSQLISIPPERESKLKDSHTEQNRYQGRYDCGP